MAVDGKESLFSGTIHRAAALGVPGKILVVTHQDHVEAALKACSSYDPKIRQKIVILAEPEARNTGPALAYAAAWLGEYGGRDSSVLVMASDHLIQNVQAFTEDVKKADLLAQKGDIVVFGIPPAFPATGYGYIETGEPRGPGRRVLSFKEKPEAKQAKDFLKAGNFLWNSGMFAYGLPCFWKELGKAAPELQKPFASAYTSPPALDKEGICLVLPDKGLKALYSSLPRQSIDYALMEKSPQIAMIPSSFDWNDVGSWDVIAGLNPPAGVQTASYEGTGNFVYSDIPTALCGVSDLIVVIKNGRALVCRKGSSQLVRKAAEDFSKISS